MSLLAFPRLVVPCQFAGRSQRSSLALLQEEGVGTCFVQRGQELWRDAVFEVWRDNGGSDVLEGCSTTDTPIDLSGLVVTVDPRAEWPQLLADVHRLYRDFFYEHVTRDRMVALIVEPENKK